MKSSNTELSTQNNMTRQSKIKIVNCPIKKKITIVQNQGSQTSNSINHCQIIQAQTLENQNIQIILVSIHKHELTEDQIEELDGLRNYFSEIITFHSIVEGSDFIQELHIKPEDERILYLILTWQLYTESLEIFTKQSFFKVQNIFIFCPNFTSEEELNQISPENSKINLITKNYQLMIESIIREFHISQYEQLQQKSAIHLNEFEFFTKFLHLDLMVKMLVQNELQFDVAYNDLEDFCSYYIETYKQKREDKENYLSSMQLEDSSSILWYTKNSFFYRMINQTLRIGNLFDIYKIRLAIKDLYLQIQELQKISITATKLYRGTIIHKNEIELWKNVGLPLIFLGFNSTSNDRLVAENFMMRNKDPNFIKVLIEIDVNEETVNQPVNISQVSQYQEEQEYLMQMNSFLIVNQVKEEKDHLILVTEIINFEQFMKDQASNIQLSEKIAEISKRFQIYQNQVQKSEKYQFEDLTFAKVLQNAEFHKEAIQILEKRMTDKSSELELNRKKLLGISYWKIGKYKEALEYEEKALKIAIEFYSKDHPCVIAAYDNIGCSYESLGQHKVALNYKLDALAIRKKINGEIHEHTATSYNNIGCSYQFLGKYQEALNYHEKALRIRQKIYIGDYHIDIAASYNNIGNAYQSLGKYEEALKYIKKSLDIKLIALGKEHADIASSYNNIGNTYQSLGKFNEALNYQIKSLQMRIKIFGDDNIETASAYDNVATTYQSLGMVQEALKYHEKSLEIRKKNLGDNHIHTAQSFNNMGQAYEKLGQKKNAFLFQSRSFEIRKEIFDECHADTAESYETLGIHFLDEDKYQQAIDYHLKALEIRCQLLGDEHKLIGDSYYHLGNSYLKLKDFEQASQYYNKSLSIYSKTFNSDHHQIILVKQKIVSLEKLRLLQ